MVGVGRIKNANRTNKFNLGFCLLQIDSIRTGGDRSVLFIVGAG